MATPPYSYDIKRADQFTEPGLITDQVINAVIDADLVIADLTGQNANAFYELAIRHMEGRPAIHMVTKGESLPFDIKDYRAISYRRDHPDDLETAIRQLREQVKTVEGPDFQVSNPVTKARGYKDLTHSGDPRDKLIADLTKDYDEINMRLAYLENVQMASKNLATMDSLSSPWRPVRYTRVVRTPEGNSVLHVLPDSDVSDDEGEN